MQHTRRVDILDLGPIVEIADGLIDGDGISESPGHTGSNGLTNGNEIIDVIEINDCDTIGSSSAVLQKERFRGKGGRNSIGHSPPLSRWYDHRVTLWYTRRTTTKWIASLLSVIVIFSSVIIILNRDTDESIVIDGEFSDWPEHTIIPHPGSILQDEDDPDSPDGSADTLFGFSSYGINLDGSFLSFFVETRSSLFEGFGSTPDILRVLIDSDDDPGTGYQAKTIGADVLIEIVGVNGRIQGSMYYQYDQFHRTSERRGNNDWNAWSAMFTVDAVHQGNKIEFQLWQDELPLRSDGIPKALFHLSLATGQTDVSAVISPHGALGISTTSLITTPVLEAGLEYPVLSVAIHDFLGRGVSINSISFMLDSTLSDHEIASSKLYSDASAVRFQTSIEGGRLFFTTEEDLTDSVVSEWSYTLSITLTRTVTLGHAMILGLQALTSPAGITIFHTEFARAYAVAPPNGPVVDGIFSEWKGQCDLTREQAQCEPPEIEMIPNPTSSDGHFLFPSFDRDLLSGQLIPNHRPITLPAVSRGGTTAPGISHTTQSSNPLPVSSSEDTLLFFLNVSPGSGYQLDSATSATHSIEVKGNRNRITSASLFEFIGQTNSDWNWSLIGSVPAFLFGSSLEMFIQIPEFRILRIHSITGDEDRSWDLVEHQTTNRIDDPAIGSVRSGESNVCINEILANPVSETDEWVELYNPTDSTVGIADWTLEDGSGVLWTGAGSDSISQLSVFTINVSNKLRNSGETLYLLDSQDGEVDNVTFPSYSSYEGLSHARIHDGAEYFERDPTPTKGAGNNVSGDVKINEIYYDVTGSEPEGEFIELFNTAEESQAMHNWTLRNDDRQVFTLNHTILTEDFLVVDSNSTDKDGRTYTDCFGTYGLGGSQDFVVLENTNGQAIDRVTYASSGSSDYFGEDGSVVSYVDSAPDVAEGESLGRYPDGSDTGDESYDFSACSTTKGKENVRMPEVALRIILSSVFIIVVMMRMKRKPGRLKHKSRPGTQLILRGSASVSGD